MSSEAPGGAAPRWLDASTTSKVADFFLSRGGKATAFCLVSAAMFNVVLAALDTETPRMPYLRGIAAGFFYLSLAMAYGSLFWTGKRTNDMVATGLGEIKHETAGLSNTSADPAINRVMQKIDAGIPHGGTAGGGTDA